MKKKDKELKMDSVLYQTGKGNRETTRFKNVLRDLGKWLIGLKNKDK